MVKLFGLNGSQEPTLDQVHEQQDRRPSAVEVVAEQTRRKSVDNTRVTGASALTTRQSIVPVTLVTTLFFMWGFAYGLLDVLNSRFQVALHITQGESSGLQAAYFGAYFIGPLTYSGWFLRRFGYRYTFILGLSIYCVGALMFWPSAVKRSFGGFCGAMFLAGSGLSTLETSANPYIAVCKFTFTHVTDTILTIPQVVLLGGPSSVLSFLSPSRLLVQSLPPSWLLRSSSRMLALTAVPSKPCNGSTLVLLDSSLSSLSSSTSLLFPKSPIPTWLIRLR